VLEVQPGQVDARAGEAAYQAVQLAAELAIAGQADGLVTAPLSKAALHAAGHYYPGHTELLAEMCGVRHFAMMLYLPPGEAVRGPVGLGVAHVTLHQSLRSVFGDLSQEAILVKCRLAHDVMRALGAPRPRLGVCALNPHAGEDGLFGDEEQAIIGPAVEAARREGLDAAGPFPTDTLMLRARDGEFDAVVAMYHDQGHIALKLLGMHAAVNITLGLPIVRTSVAHGTAFDRAWQGTARHEGMIAALETAAKLVANKRS
jgi:4-hydroxythreonine-4-phosphate dehydrogenase